jgi:hypothetical protein
MKLKRVLAGAILALVTSAIALVPAGAASAVTSPKPPGCGTSTTPQCEAA